MQKKLNNFCKGRQEFEELKKLTKDDLRKFFNVML